MTQAWAKTHGDDGFFPGYESPMLYYPEHGLAMAMPLNTDRSRVAEHTEALARIVIEAQCP
jgi:hypothetical protein